ncbi:tyrosinase family protein [Mariniflexile litorale]|uniref:Tyrosinase family protein n=1 Tax=Mariniflexile litorale TaxID=3045158 RepID=A0AAU7EFE9_9FLAO|nr:tyrosinase family protein [Mariniflexile sp. KMM 9835]MDQ8212279.1 tyrosinase family protein [Mariniflexile sp. KMM 9835]
MGNSTTAATWYGGIRQMFTQTDIDHMKPHGILLNDYDSVKSKASGIYGQLAAGNMPPGNPWPKSQVQTFLDWFSNGCPKGTPTKKSAASLKMMATVSATRIRKDVTNLSETELATLKKAFIGVMKLDITNPNSYFMQAGLHGLPNPFCMHHVPRYNPWHRAFIYNFENALRSIRGCEDVTMPYWDLFNDFPDILNQQPFDSYTLPETLNANYPKGYKTRRNQLKQIEANFKQYDVLTDFTRAKTQLDWEDYHGGHAFSAPNDTSIQAHDSGHVSIGPTMADQNVAAFDPIFWFYHCNIDRMFWEWQKKMYATDINGLLSTITTTDSRNVFTIPVLESIPPFTDTAPHLNTIKIVDSIVNLDVDYVSPVTATKDLAMASFETKRRGSVAASAKFQVDTDIANVRVKGINRIKIPGSFKVHLLKDGKVIASKAFFQPSEVDKCPNCVENPMVHMDFKIPLKTIKSGKLETWIEPIDHAPFGDHFPHKMMGNPTINVRLLLRNE